MIVSMTGFGNAEVALEGKRAVISIKSVNGKNADLSLRIPHQFKNKENEIRTEVISTLKRGKIDFGIFIETTNEEQGHQINGPVLLNYMKQMKEITSSMDDLEDDDILSIVSRFPNVVSTEKNESDDEDWIQIKNGIDQALDEIQEFRQTEGKKLESDLLLRIDQISNHQAEITTFEKERIEAVKNRLEKQLEQLTLSEGPNRDRFEQELIFYLERLDITEENVRLLAHIQLFKDTLAEEESQGKKLGFICQEIGREINTIGSKANHAGIQKIVVHMKDELEKIKEQLYNIL